MPNCRVVVATATVKLMVVALRNVYVRCLLKIVNGLHGAGARPEVLRNTAIRRQHGLRSGPDDKSHFGQTAWYVKLRQLLMRATSSLSALVRFIARHCGFGKDLWTKDFAEGKACEDGSRQRLCCDFNGVHCMWRTQLRFVNLTQARRQDVAAGGGKNQKGGHIFKIQYWMYAATGEPNVKYGGAGHHCPPAGDGPDLTTVLEIRTDAGRV